MSSYDLNLNNNKKPAEDKTKKSNISNKSLSICKEPPRNANGTDPIR